MDTRPLARSAGLIVDGIGDELLVYDTSSHRAHSLNTVATAVWRACDGTRSPEQITAHTALDPATVELALNSGHESTGISRRTALRRITVGAAGLAVALPVIRSITAPTAAMAAYNCTTVFHRCTATSQCCSGHCSGDGSCRSSAAVAPGALCSGVNQCTIGSQCAMSKNETSFVCTPE
jgi:Coenzyme PQQ synthesis protein D (PqqD)